MDSRLFWKIWLFSALNGIVLFFMVMIGVHSVELINWDDDECDAFNGDLCRLHWNDSIYIMAWIATAYFVCSPLIFNRINFIVDWVANKDWKRNVIIKKVIVEKGVIVEKEILVERQPTQPIININNTNVEQKDSVFMGDE